MLRRPSQDFLPGLRSRRASSAAPGTLWLLVALGGCATVIQEELPSTSGGSPASGGQDPGGAGFVGSATSGAGGNLNAGGSQPGVAGNMSAGLGGRSVGGNAGSSLSPSPPVDAGRPLASGTLLLEEDFEDFQGSEWLATPDSVWELTTDDELQSNVYGQTETDDSGVHLVTSSDASFGDVVVEADFKVLEFNGSSSGYMAGLCVRVRDAESFYMVGLRSGTGQIQLRAFDDGGSNLAQSSFEDGATGIWYHLRVEAVGATLSAYLDEELMFTHTDSTHPSGGIGLCTVRASAVFDNVRVTAP